MRRVLGVSAIALLLALAGTASSGIPRTVSVATGDTVAVIGTRMFCSVSKARGHVRVACAKRNDNGPMRGTYGISLSDHGRVAVSRVGKKKPVFARQPQGGGGRTFRVYFGDRFLIADSPIICDVVQGLPTSAVLYRGVKVRCYRVNRTGPLPQSHGVVMSDRFAGVFLFTVLGKPGDDVFVQKQPR